MRRRWLRTARVLGARAPLIQLREHRIARRPGYVHVARGGLDVNGTTLAAGDAMTLDGPVDIVLDSGRDAEVLLFDLPE